MNLQVWVPVQELEVLSSGEGAKRCAKEGAKGANVLYGCLKFSIYGLQDSMYGVPENPGKTHKKNTKNTTPPRNPTF